MNKTSISPPCWNQYKLIAIAPNQWDGPWMNRQQLLSRLARDRAVVYATGAWNRWDVFSQRWRRAPVIGSTANSSGVHIDHAGKLEIRSRCFPHLDRLVLEHQARRWRRVLGGAENASIIAHLFHPAFFEYLDAIQPNALVYHCYDAYAHQPNWTEELERKERMLLERADVIIASSDAIAAELEEKSDRKVVRIYNGVDYEHFASAALKPAPSDVEPIPRPRIGYVGRVNQKVDLQLLLYIARSRPNWSVVITGPIGNLDPETDGALANLKSLRNVWFLGAKPYRDLPGYVQANDVNLMCYRLGTWAKFGYPLKLHEYLASGNPVITSRIDCAEQFPSIVNVADSREAWLRLIEENIDKKDSEKTKERKATARDNDWNSRAAQLDAVLSEICARAQPV